MATPALARNARRSTPRPNPPVPALLPHRPRQTAVMAVRFAVQADSERECRQALELLCTQLGLEPALYPRQVTDDRWMARAVPRTTKAPAGGSGRGHAVCG